jgi:hypothetical protein
MIPAYMQLHAKDVAALGPFEVIIITPNGLGTSYQIVRKTGDKRVIGQFESRHDAYMVVAALNDTFQQVLESRGAA